MVSLGSDNVIYKKTFRMGKMLYIFLIKTHLPLTIVNQSIIKVTTFILHCKLDIYCTVAYIITLVTMMLHVQLIYQNVLGEPSPGT